VRWRHSRRSATLFALPVALFVSACSNNVDGAVASGNKGESASALDLARERAAFIDVPIAVPYVVQQVTAENPRHPPMSSDTGFLASAASSGFSGTVFDRALDAAPPPGSPPDAATRAALRRFARAYAAAKASGSTAQSELGGVEALASELPTVAAASERGLALDRMNALSDSTRNNPDIVALFGPQAKSDGSEMMRYTRKNVGREDEVWGGNQKKIVAASVERSAATLRSLPPGDIEIIGRWYASPRGKTESAWMTAFLARAYDAGGALMWKEYYQHIVADRTSHPAARLN